MQSMCFVRTTLSLPSAPSNFQHRPQLVRFSTSPLICMGHCLAESTFWLSWITSKGVPTDLFCTLPVTTQSSHIFVEFQPLWHFRHPFPQPHSQNSNYFWGVNFIEEFMGFLYSERKRQTQVCACIVTGTCTSVYSVRQVSRTHSPLKYM